MKKYSMNSTAIYRLFKLGCLLSISCILAINTGCKSKKPVVDPQANAQRSQLDEATSLLKNILASGQSKSWSELESKEKVLANVKNMGLDDAGLAGLIIDVEKKLADERQWLMDRDKREAEEEARRKERAIYDQLGSQFSKIASAGNTNVANALINETMRMFSSSDAPVFIVISEENGVKDYDRPTTIEKYLNYLKDQQINRNNIANIIKDGSGAIKEIELVKKQ